MSERYSIEDLFKELDGQSFGAYRDFEAAVIKVFNNHLQEFPPHYSYRNAITWADRQGWLEPTNGGVKVRLSRAIA
jgi:hypothetical protein